jgi:hypothetical protein
VNGKEEKRNERFERKIQKGLERSYALAKKQKNELNVGSKQARIVIFSDHHRGVRDGADDFMRCEKAYSAALGYYLELGYTLIVLGDAEELWECSPIPFFEMGCRDSSGVMLEVSVVRGRWCKFLTEGGK